MERGRREVPHKTSAASLEPSDHLPPRGTHLRDVRRPQLEALSGVPPLRRPPVRRRGDGGGVIYAKKITDDVYASVGRQLDANRANFGEFDSAALARQVVANLVLLGYDVVPQSTNGDSGGLRGKALREAIVAELRPDAEHYRTIYGRVAARRPVGGVDPLATFLTQLTHVAEHVGAPRSGMYRARLDAANDTYGTGAA